MENINGNPAIVANQLAQGLNGSTNGIVSSTAQTNSTHLTTLGMLQNQNSLGMQLYGIGTSLGLFDGANPGPAEVLVKYTYYGDANLDGKVDGSDYTLIDGGFTSRATGWYNGDLNYDGQIDGSDYALIDNSFNTQGARLAAAIASPTAEVAGMVAAGKKSSKTGSAVPSLFNTQTPITFSQAAGQNIETLLQKKHLLDALSFL